MVPPCVTTHPPPKVGKNAIATKDGLHILPANASPVVLEPLATGPAAAPSTSAAGNMAAGARGGAALRAAEGRRYAHPTLPAILHGRGILVFSRFFATYLHVAAERSITRPGHPPWPVCLNSIRSSDSTTTVQPCADLLESPCLAPPTPTHSDPHRHTHTHHRTRFDCCQCFSRAANALGLERKEGNMVVELLEKTHTDGLLEGTRPSTLAAAVRQQTKPTLLMCTGLPFLARCEWIFLSIHESFDCCCWVFCCVYFVG